MPSNKRQISEAQSEWPKLFKIQQTQKRKIVLDIVMTKAWLEDWFTEDHIEYMYKFLAIIFRLREIKYEITIHSSCLDFISKALSAYIKYSTLEKNTVVKFMGKKTCMQFD